MSEKTNQPEAAKLSVGDGRSAWRVHLLGLAAAGIASAVVFGFGFPMETADPILGVGWAAALVFLFWSLLLAWRAAKHGGSLGLAVWLSWLVLTEIIGPGVVLYVLRLRGWQSLEEILILKPFMRWGGAIWLLLLWVILTLALPLGWFWLRGSEKRALRSSGGAQPWNLRQRMKGLARRVLVAGVPFFVALFPIALVTSAWIRVTSPPPWVLRNAPAYAQQWGLRAGEWIPKQDMWYDYPLIDHECFSDRVLLAEMEGTRWEGQAIWGMAYRKSEDLLVWARNEIEAGNTAKSSIETCLWAIPAQYPPEVVREFLGRIVNDPRLRRICLVRFLGTLGSRRDGVPAQLRPEIDALRGSTSIPASQLLAIRSDISSADERKALWEDELRSGALAQELLVADALKYVQQLEGTEFIVERLCRSPSPAVRCAIVSALGRGCLVGSTVTSKDWFVELVLPLIEDPNLAVRREATFALYRRLSVDWRLSVDCSNLYRGISSAQWPGPPETPAELADRTKVIEAARKFLAKEPE